MNFPPSIFCAGLSCGSDCKLPRKGSQQSCVMVEPVILSCSHKFCFNCLNLTGNKCGVCGAASLDSIAVDPTLQEICDWFRANEHLLLTLSNEGSTSGTNILLIFDYFLQLQRPIIKIPENGAHKSASSLSSSPSERPLPLPRSRSATDSSSNPVSSSPPTNTTSGSQPIPSQRNLRSPLSSSPQANPPSPLKSITTAPVSQSPPRKLPAPVRTTSHLPSDSVPQKLELSPRSPPSDSQFGAPVLHKKLPIRRESTPGLTPDGAPLISPKSVAAVRSLSRSASNPGESTHTRSPSEEEEEEEEESPPSEKPSAPPPPPKPKNNTLRSSGGTVSPSGDAPTPPLKPKKPSRLVNRPQSSPDLNKFTRGPKADDFKQLFASLGGSEFARSYDWATKPVDPGSLIWKDNETERLFARTDGWVNESPKGYTKFQIEEKDKDVLWYNSHLNGKDHVIYLGGEGDNIHLIAIETCEHGEHPQPFKVLVITKEGVERIWIPESSSMKQRMKAIHHSCPHAPKANLMSHIKSPEISQELLKWEQRGVFKSYKFGILYCKEGQSTEEEIFGNEHGSPEFEEFLNCMGDRVSLKGWTQYSGGLNVDAGLEGSHSVYTQYEGFEVMFHVSTLLPFNPGDTQQLARKRHIGNDIVAIVFMDGPCPPLKPNFIKTQFIHVFIIVQLLPKVAGQKAKYKISVAAKNDVRPFTPFLPSANAPEFENSDLLREYLLTKLINAERASLGAVSFKERMGKARHLFLTNLLEMYGK